jgi:membrane protease subunit HflK
MAWNEPGGGNRDPWSGKGGDQGPPDLDEVVKKLQDRMGGLFGGRRGGGGGSGEGGGSGGGSIAGVGLLLLIAAVVIAGYKSFYIIQPAERGVVKRFGAYIQTTEPGPHFLIPFVDQVDVVNVDQINKFAHRAQMLTKDENIVDLTLTVQYRIQDSADYLFQDARPEGTIRGAMESTLREVVGKSNLDDIITANREAIAASVKVGTQELMDLYRTGLILTNVNIQDANPPEAVKAAFNDAIKAREDKERLQNQAETYANDIVPRARGAAARQIEGAKAHKARVVAEAEGETARFLALLAEYEKAPQVTRERLYLDTMQAVLANTGKVMMDNKGGSNLTYIPLDRLMQQMPAPSPSTSPRYNEPDTMEPDTSSEARTRDARSRRTR